MADEYLSDCDSDSDGFYDDYLEQAESSCQESPSYLRQLTKPKANPLTQHHNPNIEHVHHNNLDVVEGTSFTMTYHCYPISHMNKFHLENGNKIILPASALDKLASIEVQYPMMFRITNPASNRVSHCGVLEFTAEEGSVFFPNWMMTNLQVKAGQIVKVENASLPKGTYMKIQPHNVKFVSNLSDPKDVLEKIFKDFSCLTLGDTIMVDHEDQHYPIDIVETKPNRAISLFETDCELDFAKPLDYQEPKPIARPNVEIIKAQKEEKEEDKTFKPFTGKARRLDGEACEPVPAPTSAQVKEPISLGMESKVCSRKRAGKVVFGKDDDGDAIRPVKKLATNATIQEDHVKEKIDADNKKFQPFTGKKYTLSEAT